MKYLWLAVTSDKYELPLYVADTSEELAKVIGVSSNLVRSSISKKRNGKNSGRKFIKIKI